MTTDTMSMGPIATAAKRRLQKEFAEQVEEKSQRNLQGGSQWYDYSDDIALANGLTQTIARVSEPYFVTPDVEFLPTDYLLTLHQFEAHAPKVTLESWMCTCSLAAEDATDRLAAEVPASALFPESCDLTNLE